MFVRSFLSLFVCYPRFIQFALASFFADCPHKRIRGREEHATWINTIPLKIATLLNLQTLKWAYSFGTDVLIVSATSRHYSVLGRLAHRTLLAWPHRYGMSVQAPIRPSNSLLLTSRVSERLVYLNLYLHLYKWLLGSTTAYVSMFLFPVEEVVPECPAQAARQASVWQLSGAVYPPAPRGALWLCAETTQLSGDEATVSLPC